MTAFWPNSRIQGSKDDYTKIVTYTCVFFLYLKAVKPMLTYDDCFMEKIKNIFVLALAYILLFQSTQI